MLVPRLLREASTTPQYEHSWGVSEGVQVPTWPSLLLVNVGGYIEAVLDRNLAENISRVLYPNDNVSSTRG